MHCISRFIYCATEGEFVFNSTELGVGEYCTYPWVLCIVEEEVKGANNIFSIILQHTFTKPNIKFLPLKPSGERLC